MSADFFANNRGWALRIGLFERPFWPVFDSEEFVRGDWDMRPMANGNLYGINNIRTAQLIR